MLLEFSAHRPCTCFVQGVPKYFIYFGVIVNGIMSISVHSVLVYRSVMYFSVLIFCSMTLPNSFIRSRMFSFVESLGFSL